MKLQDFKKKYDALSEKKNLKGEEAMKAVKQDCNALQYVNEQTEAICLEAVKQDGFALRYVNARFFKNSPEDIIELNGVKYKRID
jgi:hypothetical protein